MTKPTTIALIEPFDYQPFHSIRQLCGLLARELSTAGFEVVSITPTAPLTTLTTVAPAVQRAVSVFERLTLSPALLRARLTSLEKRARQLKRNFIVLLSDQSLGIMAGALSGFKVACFVSDMISVRAAAGDFGQPSSFGRRFVQRATLTGLHSCDRFITPSRSTQNDLEAFIPGSGMRSSVAPLATAHAFSPLATDELTTQQNALWRTKNLLPPSYFLHVGSSAWYKNRFGVLHLIAALKKLTPASPALVFAGAHLTLEEKSLIAEKSLNVLVFENLNATELNTLYCGAEALLMPSFIEGFGWPALEALSCGTPIVITDTSSLAEHFSDAAAAVLPTPSPAELPAWAAAHAGSLLDILELSREGRAAIAQQGISHALRFSAENFRTALVTALEPLS